jgi:hypothetical protein
MRVLTDSEARKWCQAQGATFGGGRFPTATGKTKEFSIPEDAGKRVAMAAEHLDPFRRGGKTLVWFDDWAVWPSGQRMHIFERFLASYGESRPLIEAPAFLFAESEYEDLVSFVTLGILFLWDIHVVSTKARRLVFYSHDEFGWISV